VAWYQAEEDDGDIRGTLEVVNQDNLKKIERYDTGPVKVTYMTKSKDNEYLIIGKADGSVEVWKVGDHTD
jgi:hypothetical protein